MVAISTPAETRTLLEISWQTFKAMLADMGSSRNTRLAYENGVLEILTPFMAHENSNRVIESFIGVLCEELELEIKRSAQHLEPHPLPLSLLRRGVSGGRGEVFITPSYR